MKGFIEVTPIYENYKNKMLVSVASIKFLTVEDGDTLIAFYGFPKKQANKPWTALCIVVKESYDEVVVKIKEAIGENSVRRKPD